MKWNIHGANQFTTIYLTSRQYIEVEGLGADECSSNVWPCGCFACISLMLRATSKPKNNIIIIIIIITISRLGGRTC